jgi:hypothetical protein
MTDNWIDHIPYGPATWRALRAWPDSMWQRWNTIIRFFEFDCGGDWWLYLELAGPPLGELLLAIIGFDWDDVARGFLRPEGLRNRFRFRRGNPKKKSRLEIPELGELIGEHLPGAELIKARPLTTAERWLWIVDGFFQRMFYYWLIIDATTDFLYHWGTSIMRSKECATKGEDGGYIKYGLVGGSAQPYWQIFPLPTPDFQYGQDLRHNNSLTFTKPGAQVAWTFSAYRIAGGQVGPFEAAIALDPEGKTQLDYVGPYEGEMTHPAHFALVAHPSIGDTVWLLIRAPGAGTWGIDRARVAYKQGTPPPNWWQKI